LDTRAFLLTFRPLHPAMGRLLLERARTNLRRTLHEGRPQFILEERRDPSGWKTQLWIEPERDFLVDRFAVLFEQQWIVDMEIEYRRDERWGWVLNGWTVSERLGDGTLRRVTEATVTSVEINAPLGEEVFDIAR
jgi:hypothetical protein